MKLKDLHRTKFIYLGVGFILLLAITIGFLRFKSQSEFIPVNTDETKTIALEKSSDARQLKIFENERIIISIGYDQYLSYVKSDVKLLGLSHIVESRSDKIESFFDNGVMSNDFSAQGYLIVEMLNFGKASVYDKKAKREITSIVEHYQDYLCGRLCGGGSINFYFLDGTVLYNGPTWKY